MDMIESRSEPLKVCVLSDWAEDCMNVPLSPLRTSNTPWTSSLLEDLENATAGILPLAARSAGRAFAKRMMYFVANTCVEFATTS